MNQLPFRFVLEGEKSPRTILGVCLFISWFSYAVKPRLGSRDPVHGGDANR